MVNDYGLNLEGMRGVYDARSFFKRDASKEERSFICLSGPGCVQDGNGMPGDLFGARTVKIRWDDGTAETINSYSIASIFDAKGREIPKPDDGLATVEDIAHVVRLDGEEKPKVFIPVNRPAPKQADDAAPKQAKPAAAPKVKAEQAPALPAAEPKKRTAEKDNKAARPDREVIVSSPEFIALFEGARSRFSDPTRTHCKHGHSICAANAHVGDMRRPPHRYSCDLCLRKA